MIKAEREVDVLANREARGVLGRWQGKAEPPAVVVHSLLVSEPQQELQVQALEEARGGALKQLP